MFNTFSTITATERIIVNNYKHQKTPDFTFPFPLCNIMYLTLLNRIQPA